MQTTKKKAATKPSVVVHKPATFSKLKPFVASSIAVNVTLVIGDKRYTEKAATILDALAKLQPESVKYRCHFSVDIGDKHSEATLFIPQAKRVLSSTGHMQIARELFAKRLTLTLK